MSGLDAVPTPTPTCRVEVVASRREPARICAIDAPAAASAATPVTVVLQFLVAYGVATAEVPDTGHFSAGIDLTARTITLAGTIETRTYKEIGLCLRGQVTGERIEKRALALTLPAGTYALQIAPENYVPYGYPTPMPATASLVVE